MIMNGDQTVTDAKRFDATPVNSSVGVVNTNAVTEVTGAPQVPGLPVKLGYYDMTGDKYLHIFNHFKYDNNEFYGPKAAEELTRHGTHADVKSLKDTFNLLGFKITVHHDLRYQDILKEMAKVSSMDHSCTSCVAIAVMTHGQNGGVLLAADQPYYLTEITDTLENCHPTLHGKPRLWFVQACRSGHIDRGRLVVHGEKQSVELPTYEDKLVLRSSSPHYFSYRTGCGTWLIQSLCEVLNAHHQFLDLLQMITLVNQAVAYKSTNDWKKQMPETKHKMTKGLKF